MTGRSMRLAGAVSGGPGVLIAVAGSVAAILGAFPYTFRGLAEMLILLACGVYLAWWGRTRWDGAGQVTGHAFERGLYTHYCSYRTSPGRLCLRERWEHER